MFGDTRKCLYTRSAGSSFAQPESYHKESGEKDLPPIPSTAHDLSPCGDTRNITSQHDRMERNIVVKDRSPSCRHAVISSQNRDENCATFHQHRRSNTSTSFPHTNLLKQALPRSTDRKKVSRPSHKEKHSNGRHSHSRHVDHLPVRLMYSDSSDSDSELNVRSSNSNVQSAADTNSCNQKHKSKKWKSPLNRVYSDSDKSDWEAEYHSKELSSDNKLQNQNDRHGSSRQLLRTSEASSHSDSSDSVSYPRIKKQRKLSGSKLKLPTPNRKQQSNNGQRSEHSNSFYEEEVRKHREFITGATNVVRRNRRDDNTNTPKLHQRSQATKFSSGFQRIYTPPASRSMGSQDHRRLSERFTSSLSSNFSRKRSLEGDEMFSSSYRDQVDEKSVFSKEFKSDFFANLDEYELRKSRNVLQDEMDSTVPYVDTHCHIDFLFKRMGFYSSVNKYIDTTFFKFPSNFEGCIADWCQPSLYPRARSVLNTDDSKMKLWGAFGCHPHFAPSYNNAVEKQIEFHISQYDNVIAWGEMGLDYSDRFGATDHSLQQSVFVKQLQRAIKYNLPLVIHCRDADPDLYKIMKQYVPHSWKIHRHCLTTEEKDVHELLRYFTNCYVGFTNLLTNQKAYRPRDAVAKIPLERMLLETDSPYFIPRCVNEKSRGNAKWSHPGMASSVACEIAKIKKTSLNEVLSTIRENVLHLYGV